MNDRISYAEFGQTGADTLKALAAVSKSALDRGLDKAISELVKLRVSQINGCAFCIAYHLKVLRGLNFDQTKPDTVVAWRSRAVQRCRAGRASLGRGVDLDGRRNATR